MPLQSPAQPSWSSVFASSQASLGPSSPSPHTSGAPVELDASPVSSGAVLDSELDPVLASASLSDDASLELPGITVVADEVLSPADEVPSPADEVLSPADVPP